MEGPLEDFGEEVDGVSSEFSIRPPPIGVFDKKPRMLVESIVACVEREQFESSPGQ